MGRASKSRLLWAIITYIFSQGDGNLARAIFSRIIIYYYLPFLVRGRKPGGTMFVVQILLLLLTFPPARGRKLHLQPHQFVQVANHDYLPSPVRGREDIEF